MSNKESRKKRKSRKTFRKYPYSKVLKKKASKIAKRLRGFKEYKSGNIPIYLEKGLNGPNKAELYNLILKRL